MRIAKALLTLTSLAMLAAPAAAHHTALDGGALAISRASAVVPPPAQRDRAPNTNNDPSWAGPGKGAHPVPEPTALVVFGAGALVAAFALRRRRSD